jgi:hypothetical protein
MVLVVVIEIQSPGQALPVHDVPSPCLPSARVDCRLCCYADRDPLLCRRNDAVANAKPDLAQVRASEGLDARICAKRLGQVAM